MAACESKEGHDPAGLFHLIHPNKHVKTELEKLPQPHLEVPEGEDDRLGEVDSAGSSVHGGRDDVGVDNQAPAPGVRALAEPQTQPQGGVLSGQEGAQVLVEREDQLHLTCRPREESATFLTL